MPPAYTSQEEAVLLATLDYCIQNDLPLDQNLQTIMESFGYLRGFRGMRTKLSNLNKAIGSPARYTVNDLLARGSTILTLDAVRTRALGEARAMVLERQDASSQHTSSTGSPERSSDHETGVRQNASRPETRKRKAAAIMAANEDESSVDGQQEESSLSQAASDMTASSTDLFIARTARTVQRDTRVTRKGNNRREARSLVQSPAKTAKRNTADISIAPRKRARISDVVHDDDTQMTDNPDPATRDPASPTAGPSEQTQDSSKRKENENITLMARIRSLEAELQTTNDLAAKNKFIIADLKAMASESKAQQDDKIKDTEARLDKATRKLAAIEKHGHKDNWELVSEIETVQAQAEEEQAGFQERFSWYDKNFREKDRDLLRVKNHIRDLTGKSYLRRAPEGNSEQRLLPQYVSGDCIDSWEQVWGEALQCFDYPSPKVRNDKQAAYIARAVRHILRERFEAADGEDSQKARLLFKALAESGGLDAAHRFDFLATEARVKNTHFRKTEVPRLAAELATALGDGFQDIMEDGAEPAEWITELMLLKCDLRISQDLHKVVFIPPGTPFDPRYMAAQREGGGRYIPYLPDPQRYRVKHCLWPALTTTLDQKFSEEFPVDGNYKDALLQSRTFLYDGDEGLATLNRDDHWIYGNAIVTVESIEE